MFLKNEAKKVSSIKNKFGFFSFGRGGFFFLSLLLLTLNQWAQVKTNGYFSYDYVNNEVDNGVIKGIFTNPQIGFTISGALSQNSNFLCEGLFREGERVELKQAWVSLGFSNYFVPKLGLYMVPFGKYNESNRPYQTVLINPPLTAEYLYPRDWRDMGFLIEGQIKGLYYSAYIGNGLKEAETLSSGLQFADSNTSKSLGGRLRLFMDQGFEVSYSHYRGKYDEVEERNLIFHGGNIDWQNESFRILAEYIKTVMENPSDFQGGEAEGYFILASLNIGRLSPVGSFQKVKYNDPFHGSGFLSPYGAGNGIDLEQKRWGLGLIYRVLENVSIKMEYDFNSDMKDETKQHVFLCQLTLNF